jgi:MFS family permease
MSAVMAVAMVAGPLVGGDITDNLNWRWAFYVNVPIGSPRWCSS